jgi:hypothetical protein
MTAEYLTVSELSPRIKYTEQSIYNLICNGTFIEGLHFFKPTPKKILFKWHAIVQWIEGNAKVATEPANNTSQCCIDQTSPGSKTIISSINI